MAKRVLSVDDDQGILKIIRSAAVDLGFEVEVVAHSSLFMTAYVRTKPGIITLDIIMPEMDGIELIRWLGDVGCTARVILMSGASLTYSKMAARIAEDASKLAIATLRKPFRLAELRAALAGAPGEAYRSGHAALPIT